MSNPRSFSVSCDNIDASEDHTVHAFDALACHFTREDTPLPMFQEASSPLFVSWHKTSSSGQRLRGCIGCLEPRPLHSAVADYALTSALRDSRFAPIEPHEVPFLECTVSLLKNFALTSSWDDWSVGTHGIVIEFRPKVSTMTTTSRVYSATFLPEVALEQEWSRRETIDHLVRKSGYAGPVNAELLENLSVTRYESTLAKIDYREYKKQTNVKTVRAGFFSPRKR